MGLIASGALLLAVDSADAPRILSALHGAGIAGVQIGHVVEPERGLVLRNAHHERPLPRFERDEIARLFE